MSMTKLKVGDRVRYSSSFLKNIGAFTGDICFDIGEILSITKVGSSLELAEIKWDGDSPSKVNVKNLERTNRGK